MVINQLENISFTDKLKKSSTHCSFVFVLSDACIAEEFKQNPTPATHVLIAIYLKQTMC